jgi:hypothetical protein
MNALNVGEAGWAGDLLQALYRASWQGGLMLIVVWIISRTCTRIPACLKVWLWRLAFMKLLLFALPQLQVPWLPAESPRASTVTALRVESIAIARVKPEENEQPIPAFRKQWFSANNVLFGLWIFGMGCFALRLVLQWLAARRLEGAGWAQSALSGNAGWEQPAYSAAEPLSNPWLLQECGRLAEVLGLKRTPRLLQSSSCPGPLLLGIVRPAIVLPCDWDANLPPAKLRLILGHELAHLKRRDLAWGWVTSLAEIVFFFHPLVWLCKREWALAREIAADDLALQATSSSAADYGSMLLDLVEQARTPEPAILALGMFETKQTLARRIIGLRFAGATKHVRAAASLVAILAILTVVPWRLVAQTTEGDEIARLRKENEMLREQLAKAKPPAQEAQAGQVLDGKDESAWVDQDRLDGLRLKLEEAKAQLRDLSRKYTDLHPLMIEQRAKMQGLEKPIAKAQPRGDLSNATSELARATEELDRLVQRFSTDHPKVRELKARIDKLQKERAPAKAARQQALYQEELALAEQELADAKARLKNGGGSQQELRNAEREVIRLKKDFAAGSGSQDRVKSLSNQEIALVQEDLAETKKRVRDGLSSKATERALQREILRLKRELAGLDE